MRKTVVRFFLVVALAGLLTGLPAALRAQCTSFCCYHCTFEYQWISDCLYYSGCAYCLQAVFDWYYLYNCDPNYQKSCEGHYIRCFSNCCWCA
jgi:hypothetical protein